MATSDDDYYKLAEPVYTKSPKDAYASALMQKVDQQSREDSDKYYSTFKENLLNENEQEDEGSSPDDDDDDADYAWIDSDSKSEDEISDEELSSYTDEADMSFVEDEDEDFEENDVFDEVDHHSPYTINKWLPVCLCILTGIIMFIRHCGQGDELLVDLAEGNQVSTTRNLQKQINYLYNELNRREEKTKSDFDNTVNIMKQQLEKTLKKLLPANIMEFQSQLDSLSSKINSLHSIESNKTRNFGMQNVTEWQQQFIRDLKSHLPKQIPVIVNGTSSILLIPELHNFLADLFLKIVEQTNNMQSPVLEYDVNHYVKEVLSNQLQYVEKDVFIQELDSKLQLNKMEIWEEMSSRLDRLQLSTKGSFPERYSTILLKKMMNQVYNSNQHQWQDDLDFATFAQGTKILNHLSSRTWKGASGASSLELLSDSATNTPSTYWQCGDTKSCAFAIRFNKPLYLTRVSYVHGRFTNNLHMMNSAPKLVSVYIKLADKSSEPFKQLVDTAKLYQQGQLYSKDRSFVKIGQYEYNLADTRIRQNFPLPAWFIQSKPLVRSIAFMVEENYGNVEFTSLKKFIVNAVTQQDLHIIESNSFPLRSGDLPEYGSLSFFENHYNHAKSSGSSATDTGIQPNNMPSFGDDELDV